MMTEKVWAGRERKKKVEQGRQEASQRGSEVEGSIFLEQDLAECREFGGVGFFIWVWRDSGV